MKHSTKFIITIESDELFTDEELYILRDSIARSLEGYSKSINMVDILKNKNSKVYIKLDKKEN